MKKTLDVRNLECPKPVIETQKALKEASITQLEIIVGSEVSKENVKRFAESGGYDYSVEKDGEGYKILISKESWESEDQEETVVVKNQEVLGNSYLIISDKLGKGEDQLGKLLMKSFLYTLTQTEPVPKKMVLLNSAIKLSTENIEAVNHLKNLQSKGTQIYSCGTCLSFYGLTEELKVGEIGNMYDVVESLNKQGEHITIG